MQPHDNDQRPEESNSDGGRDAERVAKIQAALMAIAKVIDEAFRQVHLAEPGSTVNMSATLTGSGDVRG